MCGRYYFDLHKVSKDSFLYQSLKVNDIDDFAQDEVTPNSTVLAIIQKECKLHLKLLKWGVNNTYGQQINARIEGIRQRPYYKSMIDNRCLIPCHGFYEWKGKQKYCMQLPKESMFYLAGIYNEQNECLILTKDAYDSIKPIHHRSPIVVEESRINEFFDNPLSSFCEKQDFTIKKIENEPKHIMQFSLFDEDLL